MIVILGLPQLLALKYFNRSWWQNKPMRRLSYALPLVGLAGAIMFWSAIWLDLVYLRGPAIFIVGVVLVTELSLMITLPLSGSIRRLGNWIVRKLSVSAESVEANSVDLGRRKALGALAAAIPIGALSIGASGFGRALAGAKVYERKMVIDSLSEELKGLKIFHMSDLHLGPFVKLDDLEKVVAEADKFHPDLVLITGDIADEVPLLSDALKLIDQLGPRLGSFASLGNHEHFRGVERIRKIFDHSPVRLLVDEGVTITDSMASLCLAAIDDPRRMGGDHAQFYRTSLDRAMLATRTDDTVILMSHRPSVFDLASEYGIDLTLAGHTHGGQLGLMGHSVLEVLAPESYLWGHYTRGKSQLYTSAGMGHWFPFRLGCPPEAPIITLA